VFTKARNRVRGGSFGERESGQQSAGPGSRQIDMCREASKG
jgi:hypothetical protein